MKNNKMTVEKIVACLEDAIKSETSYLSSDFVKHLTDTQLDRALGRIEAMEDLLYYIRGEQE